MHIDLFVAFILDIFHNSIVIFYHCWSVNCTNIDANTAGIRPQKCFRLGVLKGRFSESPVFQARHNEKCRAR